MIIDRECSMCDGEGKVWESRWGGNDPDVWSKTCPVCEGSGVVEVDLSEEYGDDEE